MMDNVFVVMDTLMTSNKILIVFNVIINVSLVNRFLFVLFAKD
jgi:hypothetical protein